MAAIQPPAADAGFEPIVRLPRDLRDPVMAAVRAREGAARATEIALQRTRRAVFELASRGYSRRDTALLLGISHQRVHQLLEGNENSEDR